MDKIYNQELDETYYKETLDNGLQVIIINKPDFLTTFAGFGAYYGALNIAQKVDDKEYNFNPGVAHFLEHKLFENDEYKVFESFSQMGCSVNAFTSLNETVYHFTTSNRDIEKPLNLLLDFVQSFNITEESVEKEKDIIIQEVNMYKQDVDSRLMEETLKSLYIYSPIRNDIGGDNESIKRINKEELELCYKINYHPSNMILVVVSPIDPYKIIDIVRKNQASKGFKKASKPISNNRQEPLQVNRKEYNFNMDINKAKHVYGIKLKPCFKDAKEFSFKEWCLYLYLKIYFSSSNPNYQEWLDKGIINDYFSFDVDFSKEFAYIIFSNESDDDNLKELVDEELKKDLLTEEALTLCKRKLLGASFRVLNDIENFGIGYMRDYLNGYDFFDNIKIIESITLDDLKIAMADFDLANYSLIHVYPQG